MNLSEILKIRDFDFSKTKLVRHKDNKTHDLNMIFEAGKIMDYQSVQSNDVFKDCDYIISFLGIESCKAKLIGVYKIIEKTKVKNITAPTDFPYPDVYSEPEYYYYRMEELHILDDLKERLIIDWGKATLSWCIFRTDSDRLIRSIQTDCSGAIQTYESGAIQSG